MLSYLDLSLTLQMMFQRGLKNLEHERIPLGLENESTTDGTMNLLFAPNFVKRASVENKLCHNKANGIERKFVSRTLHAKQHDAI